MLLSGAISSPFFVRSGAPQESVLGHLLVHIFINELCDVINHTVSIFSDDLKVYRAINSPTDCLLLQSGIHGVKE
jgi:hypothetical protein